RRKREKRRRYCAKLNELKHQQAYLKHDVPETYDGSPVVTKIKKWCWSVKDLKQNGRLRTQQAIRVSGKYLSDKAYRFFELNVLQNRKKYRSLTEYFEDLFDYLFPPGFRMQQRDKFDRFEQRDLPALDFLRRIQELADTVGDLEEKDVVLAFWRRCVPYIRAELTIRGFEPSDLSIRELEDLVTRFERAHQLLSSKGVAVADTLTVQTPRVRVTLVDALHQSLAKLLPLVHLRSHPPLSHKLRHNFRDPQDGVEHLCKDVEHLRAEVVIVTKIGGGVCERKANASFASLLNTWNATARLVIRRNLHSVQVL
ncbi:hypothetical protein HWV62_5608, partial [Athelia sp. TMB]